MSANAISFGDDVPLNPVDAGTNLLVSGPTDAGLKSLVHRLIAPGEGEGLVSITTDSGDAFLRDQRQHGGAYDDDATGVVGCASSPGTPDELVRSVTGTADLSALSMEFSALSDDVGYQTDRLRSGLYSVSPLCESASDMRDVYRFLNSVVSRNRRSRGVFVCGIDPEANVGEFGSGENITKGISMVFQGHVELRDGATGPEIRVTGLDGQPDGWQSLD
ncbi:DUF7504 family protein [Halogeometricum limi]|uniref:RecA-superfamily ATPase, KaiC/GvpD/RAD55 family n=1 Tax=Halogeometricum limi TaxID=555875 RepID=A0A1I6IAG7_9EURY|nr:hypothetical protein [Halogeometricum limi]SFR63659.1 hypothetical protein SAMN04488124_2936 [Halogeometricum limi]